MNRPLIALFAALALGAAPAPAADPDVTGLVPTIWWDFETQPDAGGLANANKGSAGTSFSHEGTKTYKQGVGSDGWALDTSRFTPYSGAGSFSTAGNAFTVSLVMTLGSKENGITLNVRTTAGDLIVRRGSTEGSLVVGFGAQQAAQTQFLGATFADGDAAWHLVSVVGSPEGTALYVDGELADSSADFTPWSASGKATQMQFGGHLNVGAASGEAKNGGLIDDLRIHDAALMPAQIKAIAQEYRLVPMTDALKVSGSPGNLGTVVPRYGITNGLAQGAVVACSATGSETEETKLVPVGHALYSIAADGTETLAEESAATSFTYTHGTEGARLVWRWAYSNFVDVAAGEGGTVSAGGWVEFGGSFSATATPAAGYRFHHWEGDVPWSDRSSPTIVLSSVSEPASLAAVFTLGALDATPFAKRIPVVVSGYAGQSALECFPVLVRLAAGAPEGFSYADCAEGGADLRFADAEGNLVPHEIESWDPSGDSFIWVQVPMLSGTTTSLSLYYGAGNAALPAVDPADVWARYAVVVHGGSGISDSSPSALPVANGGGVAATADSGVVAGGLHKAARNSKGVNIPNPVTNGKLSNTEKFTLTTWYKSVATGTSCMSASKGNWNGTGFLLLCEGGSYMSVAVGGHQGASGKGALVKDQWAHVAFSYDTSGEAGSLRTYFDGENIYSKDDARAPTDGGAAYWTVGSHADTASGDSFVGDMDEIRLFDGIASADWIRAEHDSMAAPTNFAALGPVAAADADKPQLGGASASDANGTATFSVALAVPGFGGAVPTSVSVFYGTDGENWTELSLGSTNEAATLTGSASGFAGNVRVLWYATATATQNGATKSMTTPLRSFVTKALDPAGNYKSFTATVDWDGEPAEDIPVLLRLSEATILGFSYADVTASGLEILDATGHLLPHEIDTWNTNGESVVWVRLPDYRDGATLTVRYGTAFSNEPISANFWSDCLGVWHMNEASPADASLSGNDGTAVGAPAVAAGTIGSALSLPASSSYVTCGTALPNSKLASGFTVEGWANPATVSGTHALFAKKQFISVRLEGTKVMVTTPNVKDHEAFSVGVTAGTWFHWAMTFVPGSDGLRFYVNGTPVNTQRGYGFKDAASATEMWLGQNEWGGQEFRGLLDEMRLRAGIRSADWLAAEYHAMADGSLSLSAVASSDMTAPVLGEPSVARNSDGSFTVSVEVSENLPDSIFCTLGGTDYAMTTADAALPATYSVTPAGLPAGTYTASVRASSAGGTTVSAACPAVFHAGALAVEKISDADEGTLTPGVFRISRADADPAGLPALAFDVAFSGDGLAAVVAPGIATATIPAGESSVDIAIAPVFAPDIGTDATVALAVSGAYVGQPSGAAMAVLSASYDPAVRYVATTGDDANHGGTPELPKKTIGAAVDSLANVARSEPCTVHVAPGLYPISSPIAVTNAIRVLGDDPDPSRVVVSNAVDAGWNNQNQRVFSLGHPDALVANLTMQKGWYYYGASGGNLFIGSAGGMVSNCVVEAGSATANAAAGGAWLDGGIVTHAVFRRNTCGSGSASWSGVRAGVLHLQGSARAENCLLADNSQSKNVALVVLGGNSVMRNCSIVDSGLSLTNSECKAWSALQIASGATALNVVVAGVTNTVDGAPCPPTGTVANFLSGAFDGDASALPEGTVSGTIDEFFPHHAESADPDVRYRPTPGSPLYDAGGAYAPLAAFDLSGRQPRLVGAAVDIGCYEDAYLRVEATGEPTVGLESFATDFAVGAGVPAAVSIVWSADASFAGAATNTVAEGVTNGVHEASIGGLEPDTLYWWKLVADNGVQAIETAPASFRTLGAPTFGEVGETVSGATVRFSVGLASIARDELGNGIRTYVTVFCTTNGTDWIERSLGSATRAPRTLVASATLPNGVWTWYARASAESGGRTFAAETGTRTFRVFHNETPPAGFHRLDATIAYAGEPAEDVPVLLRLSESIEGFRYADVANDGRDFLFSDQDGNLLPFEIDVWDPAGESLVWVRVPVFADGTVVHLDYGASETDGTADAADVWRRYVGVWHLGETNAASAYGSYPNSTATAGIDGEKAKASIAGQAGRFGRSVKICNSIRKGAGYERGGVFVPDAGENAPLDLGSTFMISGWFRHEDQDYYWDKLFAKRKSTNNEGSPNGAFVVEMDSAGSNSRVTVAGNGGNTGAATLDASLRNAWSHLAFVFDGKSCAIYQDGAFCRTTTISAVSDNDAPLCFGNTTGGYGDGAGTSAWCGWMDEVRLADGVPTAAWLAAEHAAMAPGTNVVRFSAVRDLQMPVLDGAPDLAWGGSSFRYAATVAYGLGDVLLTTVDLYDGTATTNATHSFDSPAQLPQSFSDAVSLGEDRMYRAVAVLRSADGMEEDLAAADRMVYSGQLTATWIADADIAAMTPAIVRLSRADTEAATCADLTVSLALFGEAVSKGLLESVVSATIPAGTNSVDVAIRPIARSVVPGDYTATLAVAGTNVANPAGTRVEFGVLNAGADPYVRYVAPDGDDGNDGALATRPKRTIAGALASFSDSARSALCTVHVAPGLYPIESPIVLTNAVRVLGDDPDPSRAVVSNTVGANWTSGNQRVFTISHPDALVANLTMQDGSVWGDWSGGGNFLVDTAGGTVSNCLVEAGHVQWGGHCGGGGGRLAAGLVTHTVFRGNHTVTGSSPFGDGPYRAGVLMLMGGARAENCLVVDNPQSAAVTLVRLDGSSSMRNCTIVDSPLAATNENCTAFTALRITSSSATVLDTVVAGVTNTVDGAPCVPTGHVERFRNGAVDGSVAGLGLPAETVVGSPASFFRNRARGDYRPRSGGPLVGAGANYEPMSGVDLSGVQPRKVGTRVDIGCYEAFAETTVLILR